MMASGGGRVVGVEEKGGNSYNKTRERLSIYTERDRAREREREKLLELL
jgi:hypothetical protein